MSDMPGRKLNFHNRRHVSKCGFTFLAFADVVHLKSQCPYEHKFSVKRSMKKDPTVKTCIYARAAVDYIKLFMRRRRSLFPIREGCRKKNAGKVWSFTTKIDPHFFVENFIYNGQNKF